MPNNIALRCRKEAASLTTLVGKDMTSDVIDVRK